MTPEQRRAFILTEARSGQRLEVEALVATLGISRETIRRDLAMLDKQGTLRRVHGGALLGPPGVLPQEGPFADRMGRAVAAKRAIARHVAAGLRPGDSLFIDTGSTTLYLAEELARLSGLIVITNSADIAAQCQRGTGNSVVLIGGAFRGPGRETVGPLALSQISQLRAARAILTVAAVTERGVYDIDGEEAEVARRMIDQADAVTVLADSSKIGSAGVYEVCPMRRVSVLVTDGIAPPLRRAIEANGTAVAIVTPD